MNERFDAEMPEVSRVTDQKTAESADLGQEVATFSGSQEYASVEQGFTNNAEFRAQIQQLTGSIRETVPEIAALSDAEKMTLPEVLGDVTGIEVVAETGDVQAMASSVATEMFAVKPVDDGSEPGTAARLVGWAKNNWRNLVAAGAMAAAGAVHAAGPQDVIIDRGIQEIQIEADARMRSSQDESRYKVESKIKSAELNEELRSLQGRIQAEVDGKNAAHKQELEAFDQNVLDQQEIWKHDPRMTLQEKDKRIAEFVKKRHEIESRQERDFNGLRDRAKRQMEQMDEKIRRQNMNFGHQVERERSQVTNDAARARSQADTRMNQELLRQVGGQNKREAGTAAAILIGKQLFGR